MLSFIDNIFFKHCSSDKLIYQNLKENVVTCNRFSDTDDSLRYIIPSEKNKVKLTLTAMNRPRTTNTLSVVSVCPVITYTTKTTKAMMGRAER